MQVYDRDFGTKADILDYAKKFGVAEYAIIVCDAEEHSGNKDWFNLVVDSLTLYKYATYINEEYMDICSGNDAYRVTVDVTNEGTTGIFTFTYTSN